MTTGYNAGVPCIVFCVVNVSYTVDNNQGRAACLLYPTRGTKGASNLFTTFTSLCNTEGVIGKGGWMVETLFRELLKKLVMPLANS